MDEDREISPQEGMLRFFRVVRTAERDCLIKRLFPEGIGPYEQEKVVARIRRHFPEVTRSEIYKMNPGQFKQVTAKEHVHTETGDGGEPVAVSKVAIGRTMADDEIDLDNGFLIAPVAVPVPPPPPADGETGGGVTPLATGGEVPAGGEQPAGSGTGGAGGGSGGTGPTVRTGVRITFPASRDNVFKSFQAIANLAHKSDGGKIKITIDGRAATGYDPNWLRNAVEEPLDEANIEGLEISEGS